MSLFEPMKGVYLEKLQNLIHGKSLLIVSNREPYVHERTHAGITCVRSIGGLVSALDPVMQACGGTWIAWGSTATDFDVGTTVRVPPHDPKYSLKRIQLSEEEVELFYRSFSNRALWPLFHLFQSRARFDPKEWAMYRRVNAKFANAVLQKLGPKTRVMIHDYHLALVPRLIRNRAKRARISFFWHIPWGPWETFRNLPWRREFLEGILGADLVGFHTKTYVKNFAECLRKELGVKVRKSTANLDGRSVRIGHFPLGIDYEQFTSPPEKVKERTLRLRKELGVEHTILSIGRLDYTKGILQRLEGYERFLEKYPQFRGEVELLLVVTPSRTKVPEYRAMREEIDRTVGKISGRFHRVNWVPIRYFYRTVSQEELLTFYRAADVALATPLVDGMNLISKEYVASSGGVLILSEFAGAAEQLKGSILINPHDTERYAGSIKTALKMPPAEKRRRSRLLKAKVKKFDAFWWVKRFLGEWEKCYRKP